MIKINDSNRKVFYYVSNVKAGLLTIIDGNCNSIVKNIFVGKRPFNIAVMNNNKICVACDRSNSISVLDCLSNELSRISVPNDGNIEVDKLNEKMFISNTYEINILDIATEKIVSSITGFLAITALKLSKDSSKLYVLDKILREFRIYNTNDSSLIHKFNNIVENPEFFLISKDDKIAYISTGYSSKNIDFYNLLKLDIFKEKVTLIELPKGSIITGMLIKGEILYAANKGLNRIELINTDTDKPYSFILTSMPEPNRLCISNDETKILVANRNSGDSGAIDIIDAKTNNLIGCVIMNSPNSQPYDVVSVSLNLDEIYNAPMIITDLNHTKEPLVIIAKKVFQCYCENINFIDISIGLSENSNLPNIFKKIRFENGVIVNGSEIRAEIEEMPGFSRLQFILRITYIIQYVKNNENTVSFKGFLEKNQDIIFAIPKERDVNEFEIKINTSTKLVCTPRIIDNVISFGVTTSLEIKIIGEDEISIPSIQHSRRTNTLEEDVDKIKEHFETFLEFSGSIFPEGAVFPYLNEYMD